jgi:hypothetical protein
MVASRYNSSILVQQHIRAFNGASDMKFNAHVSRAHHLTYRQASLQNTSDDHTINLSSRTAAGVLRSTIVPLCTFMCALISAASSDAQGLSNTLSQPHEQRVEPVAPLRRWHIAHVISPTTKAPVSALLQVADPDRSDPDFIGMMIRCSDAAGRTTFLPVFVIADPFPPQARPQVTLRDNDKSIVTTADVIPPGAAISIPIDIQEQILDTSPQTSNLSVVITYQHTTIHGAISLAGLSDGLSKLAPECASH